MNVFNGILNLFTKNSDQQITLIIQARVLEAYQNFMKAILGMLPFGVSPSLLDSPIIKHAIYGDIDPQFINFMAPGIMITIIFILTIGLTALMFVIEKKEGILERTSLAGINTFELILSHISVKLIVMFFQTAVLLIIANLVFNVNMVGSIFLAGLLLLLQGFCGMSFG
jgi:ABC-type transport system involved in cytochrome c biogenesis permease component